MKSIKKHLRNSHILDNVCAHDIDEVRCLLTPILHNERHNVLRVRTVFYFLYLAVCLYNAFFDFDGVMWYIGLIARAGTIAGMVYLTYINRVYSVAIHQKDYAKLCKLYKRWEQWAHSAELFGYIERRGVKSITFAYRDAVPGLITEDGLHLLVTLDNGEEICDDCLTWLSLGMIAGNFKYLVWKGNGKIEARR